MENKGQSGLGSEGAAYGNEKDLGPAVVAWASDG